MPSLVEIDSMVLQKIFWFRQCFSTILLLSPLGKRRGPSFEQTWIPFTLGCCVLSLVDNGPVILESNFNFVNVFSLFRNYLALEKGVALYLNKLESPWPKNALCQVWYKVAHAVVLEKKMKIWKVYRQMDGQRKKDDQKDWLKLSAQVS